MRSKSKEEVAEIEDRSPVQNGCDPISNLDENKRHVLIGPTESQDVSWKLLTLKKMCKAVGSISQVQSPAREVAKMVNVIFGCIKGGMFGEAASPVVCSCDFGSSGKMLLATIGES